MSYFDDNKKWWEKGYNAPWPDHCVFRFFGRVLKPDFPQLIGGKLLDFGCGQGAAANYFHLNGMDTVGVDISETDLNAARARYPHMAGRFVEIDPDPSKGDFGPAGSLSVVTAIQSMYYFKNADMKICLDKLYDSMAPGGVFYATMMGTQCKEFYDNSTDAGDGLRKVEFKNDRIDCQNYFMSFIEDEDHLRSVFSMFKPVHVGHYSAKFRNDEGDGFHYTFVGQKAA